MGLLSTLRDNWRRTKVLAATSYGVLKRDRFLMAFPALSLAAAVIINVVIWVVVWATTTGLSAGTVDDPDRWVAEPIVWIGLVANVLLCTFVSIYFTAALTYGAWERLQGRAPTFEGCISAANARLHVIVPWAILAGIVGLIIELLYRLPNIIQHLNENVRHIPVIGPFAGFAALAARILALVLDSLWYFLTYLVVPILVVEETGPFTSCKRSFQLFRQTWGKSIIGQVAFDLIGLLIALPGLILAGLIVLAGWGNPAALVVGIGIGVLWLLAVLLAMSAIVGIFKMALYLYATTGEVPGEFQGTGLEEAFASKTALKAERKAKRKAEREKRKSLGANWRNLWTIPSENFDAYVDVYYGKSNSEKDQSQDSSPN